jgi:hypothetical protein
MGWTKTTEGYDMTHRTPRLSWQIILLSAVLLVSYTPSLRGQYLRVTAKTADVRAQPNPSSTVVVQATLGDLFKLQGKEGAWFEISMFGGEYRYLHESVAEVTPSAPALPESVDTRRRAFVELVQAQDRAVAEAERRYPRDYARQIDYERLLYDRYELPILRRYGISPARYGELIAEGIRRNWVP